MIARRLPRGHSNVYADETGPWPGLPDKARVPLVGGSQVTTCRSLPPLALGRSEWEAIGRRMGWLSVAPVSASVAVTRPQRG